jgi:thiosulfate/3-mercaptopyruvate sulfurtransferase
MVIIESPLVSSQWLHQNLNASNIVVLDASIPKVTDNNSLEETIQIPHTRFFDIKNKFSDVSAKFPSAVPSVDQFTNEAQKLGINKDSAIVIYDDKGIYSSARAWYLFKAFGCNNVAVLDGGLPGWKKESFQIEDKTSLEIEGGNFEGKYNSEYFKFFDDVKSISNDSKCLILDARSSNRFKGAVPEPREGLRSGTIPNSRNLPFTDLINGNCLKSNEELKAIFNNLAKPDKKLIFSCGSGITACILALAAEMVNYKNLSVYDGSWTEYGSLTKQ